MKVLLAMNWLARGGIETTYLRCLPEFKRAGASIDVCCTGPEQDLDDAFREKGCRVHRLAKSANPWRTAKHLARLLEEHPRDVVHSQLGYTSGGMVLGARRRGLPAIVSFHSSQPTTLYAWRNQPGLRQIRGLFLLLHRRLILRHANALVGHSRTNLDAFYPPGRQEPSRHRVIYNGIPIPDALPNRFSCRAALGIGNNEQLLLHVGTFRKEKNHLFLMETLRRLIRRGRPCRLLLAGAGTAGPECRALAERCGVARRITPLGTRSEVWSCYRAADVFLFPSESEGFGNVLVEAQGASLPVVASDLPAHRESVAPAQHRFLFPLPDVERAADLLVEQIEAAGAGANPWVEKSREWARREFSARRMVEKLVALYNSVCNPTMDAEAVKTR